MDISSFPSYAPKAALIGFGIIICIMVAELYFSLSGRKKLQEFMDNGGKMRKQLEPELKPLKFPEVPKQQPKIIVSAQTVIIVISVVFLIAGGGMGVYVTSTPKVASLVSVGSAPTTQSISIISPTPTPTPTPASLFPTKSVRPTSTPVPTKPFDTSNLQFFQINDDDTWTSLTDTQMLEQPANSTVYIGVHFDEPHSGFRLTVNGTDYITSPSDKTPDGDYYLKLPRPAITDVSGIYVTPLP